MAGVSITPRLLVRSHKALRASFRPPSPPVAHPWAIWLQGSSYPRVPRASPGIALNPEHPARVDPFAAYRSSTTCKSLCRLQVNISPVLSLRTEPCARRTWFWVHWFEALRSSIQTPQRSDPGHMPPYPSPLYPSVQGSHTRGAVPAAHLPSFSHQWRSLSCGDGWASDTAAPTRATPQWRLGMGMSLAKGFGPQYSVGLVELVSYKLASSLHAVLALRHPVILPTQEVRPPPTRRAGSRQLLVGWSGRWISVSSNHRVSKRLTPSPPHPPSPTPGHERLDRHTAAQTTADPRGPAGSADPHILHS